MSPQPPGPDDGLQRQSSTPDSQQRHLLSPMSTCSAGSSFHVTFDSLDQQSAPASKRVREEVARLTKLSGPLIIQNFLAYSTTVVAVAFVGHLNQPELLSSAVLANSLYNVTGYSLLQGLASGMESLCGQAFGGRNYKTLGLVLQRALLINWAMCIPITVLWTHSEKLLLLLGQQPVIAAGAALYLRLITPTLYMNAVVECLKRYLLAQRVVVPGMVVTVLTCLLSPLYNWLFIFRLQLGLTGAALAFSCSQATTAVLLTLYAIVRDARMAAQQHEQATWCKPSLAMFAGWGAYLSFGLPATIQLCTEWWMYEVVIFMAGVPLAAYFGLYLRWSVKGFWAALATTSAVMAVVQLAVIARFDWQKEVQRAAQMMAQHEDEAADGKAADLAAAVGAPVVVRAVSSSGDGSWASEVSVLQQTDSIQEEDESDTAPLLDAGGVSGGGVSGVKHGFGQQQQQRRVSDQGVRQPSRLSRLSQSEQQRQQQQQQQQQRGSLDGALSGAWLQWPFGSRQTPARSEEHSPVNGQATGPSPQRQLMEQGSLTRGLLRSHPSVVDRS